MAPNVQSEVSLQAAVNLLLNHATWTNTGEACCSVPPAAADYKEKGSYIEVDGMKTCMTPRL